MRQLVRTTVPLLLVTLAACCGNGEDAQPVRESLEDDRETLQQTAFESEEPTAAPVAKVVPIDGPWTTSDGGDATYTAPDGFRFPCYLLYPPDGRLTHGDLAGLTAAEMRVWRNAIYAQYGYPFKSADLQQIYGAQSWYERNSRFDSGTLTPTDKANIRLLKDAEKTAR